MKKIILALTFLFLSASIVEAQNFRSYRNSRRVGYRPNIVWLPSGTYMGTRVTVGPNRRYVRIGVNVGFSSIPRVDTFNFINGQSNQIFNGQQR